MALSANERLTRQRQLDQRKSTDRREHNQLNKRPKNTCRLIFLVINKGASKSNHNQQVGPTIRNFAQTHNIVSFTLFFVVIFFRLLDAFIF